jgi:DNA polymerase III subunit delta'
LPATELQQIILAEGIASDERTAARLAEAGEGSVSRARELADPELWAFRNTLIVCIARPGWDIASVEKAVNDFVQAAGSEAALRRDRLRTVIGFVLEHYRERMRELAAGHTAGATATTPGSLLPALDACLTATEQVDRNANQSLVISHWLANIAGYAHPLPRIGV